MTKVHLLWFAAFLVIGACQRSDAHDKSDGFEIAAHDVASGQYTILERHHQADGRYVTSKIVAVCKSYHWENHPAVDGPDSCDLPVGRIYRTNILDRVRPTGEPDMYVEITTGGDGISIQEGSGNDKVSNYLFIVSQAVTHEGPENAS